jgi:hypothetical protein
MEVQNGSLKDDGSSRRDAEAQIAADETHDQEGGGISSYCCAPTKTHIFLTLILHITKGEEEKKKRGSLKILTSTYIRANSYERRRLESVKHTGCITIH